MGMVHRYNTTPKDDVSATSEPDNSIYTYRVRIKGIDGVYLPDWRKVRRAHVMKDTVWVRPPNSRWTTNLKKERVTNIVSEHSVLVDGIPHPALETTPLASDGENESPESELLIEPISHEVDDSPENSIAKLDNCSESSSEENVQTIPLRGNVRNKSPHPYCYLCDHETHGWGSR